MPECSSIVKETPPQGKNTSSIMGIFPFVGILLLNISLKISKNYKVSKLVKLFPNKLFWVSSIIVVYFYCISMEYKSLYRLSYIYEVIADFLAVARETDFFVSDSSFFLQDSICLLQLSEWWCKTLISFWVIRDENFTQKHLFVSCEQKDLPIFFIAYHTVYQS